MTRLIDYGRTPISMPPSDAIPPEYRDQVGELFATWENVRARNDMLASYYHMHNEIHPLGISAPSRLEQRLRPVCGWAAKAVKARTTRQVFEGYVSGGGGTDATLDRLFRENRMASMQARVDVSKFVYGLSAYTVMPGNIGQPDVVVRSYSARQFAALWDKDANRIACGVVLSNVDADGNATQYTVHLPDAVLDLVRNGNEWSSHVAPHSMGRPLMEVVVNDPDDDRPLGHSILTPEVIDIIDTSLRDLARMEIASEFYAFPQRYILGASEDLFTQGVDEDESDEETTAATTAANKLKTYLGTYLAITKDEDGDVPTVGQFSPSDPESFSAAYETAAQRFSGATNVPLAQLGVLSNNYTSSDALSATNDPLILEVEAGNRADAEALEVVGRMMLAEYENTDIAGLGDRADIQAAFRDPSMPTLASRADAWAKLASVDADIVGTRVFYEGIGLSQATIDRLEAEKRRRSVTDALNALIEQGGGEQ